MKEVINMKNSPVLYRKKEECCGCSACYAICPQNAIEMEMDEEGFEYPKITKRNNCIGCKLCIKVCPLKS